jgi:hypothetical protein
VQPVFDVFLYIIAFGAVAVLLLVIAFLLGSLLMRLFDLRNANLSPPGEVRRKLERAAQSRALQSSNGDENKRVPTDDTGV